MRSSTGCNWSQLRVVWLKVFCSGSRMARRREIVAAAIWAPLKKMAFCSSLTAKPRMVSSSVGEARDLESIKTPKSHSRLLRQEIELGSSHSLYVYHPGVVHGWLVSPGPLLFPGGELVRSQVQARARMVSGAKIGYPSRRSRMEGGVGRRRLMS